jgi:uncharacterized protein (TIRG00374 family)
MAMVGATVAPRRAWTAWVRLLASVGFFAVIVYKAHLGEALHDATNSATVGYLALGVAVTGIGIILSAWRWQRVLVAIGEPVPLRRLTSLYFAGQFIGNVLPTSIGGDVLRVLRLSADTGSSTSSFASVVLERMTGWVVLPVLSLTGFALSPEARDMGAAAHVGLGVAAGTLLLLAIVLFLAGHPRAAGRFADRKSWSRFIGAVHFGVVRLRRHPGSVLGVLGASFVYQFTTVLAFALAIRIAGLHVPLAAVLAIAPIVAIAQVVSPLQAGLGLREGALFFFLRPLVGANLQDASTAGVVFFAMVAIVSLWGIPSFVRNRPQVMVQT